VNYWIFLQLEKKQFALLLQNEEWCAKLAYLADIFNQLNSLNSSMQGRNKSFLTSCDKINGFLKKLCTWKIQVGRGNLEMFPLAALVDPIGRITSSLILTHLQTLSENLKKYFPSIAISQF